MIALNNPILYDCNVTINSIRINMQLERSKPCRTLRKCVLREIAQNKSVNVIYLVLTKYHRIGYKRAGATIYRSMYSMYTLFLLGINAYYTVCGYYIFEQRKTNVEAKIALDF